MIINSDDLLALEPIKDMASAKVSHNGVSHGLGEAGYDIRIKQDVLFKPNNRGNFYVYVEDGDLVDGSVMESKFTLASALEYFQMPPNLVGVVHDKSTWARRGLSVFNTVIEPGWFGYLTLELVYHGNGVLHIPAGSGIAQVLFHEVSIPQEYKGKYMNQENKPVPAKESK